MLLEVDSQLGNKTQKKDRQGFKLSPTTKVNVAYVIEKFPSPTEYFILNEILELEKRGFNIFILVLQKQKRFLHILKDKNLKSPVIYLPRVFCFLPFLSLFIYPISILRFSSFSIRPFFSIPLVPFIKQTRNYCISLYFLKKLKDRKIEHIHAHFAFIASEIGCLLSRQLGVKFSFTAHAQDIYLNPAYKLNQLLREASFAITCTKYNRDYIDKVTGNKNNKLAVVYHGIDITKWQVNTTNRKLSNPKIRILSVARLVEKKGLLFLLRAIKLLIDKGYRAHCTIIGKGPLRKKMEKYVKDFGLYNYVDIPGFLPQSELKQYFINADIFILPCIVAENKDRDGLPNVILEAMVMGVPVISTNISAIPEVIEHRETGFLVREKDEQAIVNTITELWNDRKLYMKISEDSKRKIFKEFSIERSTDELVTIFRNNQITK